MIIVKQPTNEERKRAFEAFGEELKMAYILMINSDVAAVYSNRQDARKDAEHFREKGQNTSIMTVPYHKQSILE
ncbi:hypothetical protein [Lactiplantibacillus plantarum]|uniref:hypothetical protein n=1 Tax=Lactiplantibacillus plantarum TaxID=1590 RepID=UPI0007BC1DDA|nr:hypothetical protein [Lactiplantibacillus plantarum]KZU55206.1 hypothetical protein Nizo2802_1104 [Lactiplantibacillus plantarum]QIL58115.1 hypothetical protein EPJ55_10950 [Lactiplantibacillus plantarum]